MRPSVIAALLLLPGAPGLAQDRAPALAEGAWFDPQHSGQGLMLDALANGQVFAAWFAFGSGPAPAPQRWYTALLRPSGSVLTGALLGSAGGALDAAPGAVATAPTGSLRLDFLDCRTARLSWSVAEPGGGNHGQWLLGPGADLVEHAPCAAAAKLRWPHAPPGMAEADYAALEDAVFIMNNFGQHQGGDQARPDALYLHDGVDLMLPNGTPIHALEDGTVRAVEPAGSAPYGFTVTVESAAYPGHGWSYVHVTPSVAVGDAVQAGQPMGGVRFDPAPHLHLSRVRRPAAAPGWSFQYLLTRDPLPWFALREDNEPPLLLPRLRFLDDATGQDLPPGAPLSGAVDIVAGARDPGPHARGVFPGGVTEVGDLHAVAWIEYSIEGEERFVHQRAFDLQTLEIGRTRPDVWSMQPVAEVLYRPILRVPLDAPGERSFHYYILTHGSDRTAVTEADASGAWHTDALDDSGARLFPDGSYTLTVRAGDAAGNIAAAHYAVEVRND